MFKRSRARHRKPDSVPVTIVKHTPPAGLALASIAAGVGHSPLLSDKVVAVAPTVIPEPTFGELVDPGPLEHKTPRTIAERKKRVIVARHVNLKSEKPVQRIPERKPVAKPTIVTPRSITLPPNEGKWVTVYAALRSQLGVPYIYGGETPGHGFDCSGLTQWAFGKVGIHLPRTAESQAIMGFAVRSPKPGDLVLYPGHVGVYIGNGKMIAAPHSGEVVRIQDVYGSPRYRRII
jgi:cell wall-associated NlpC family hydrolase